MTSRLPIRDYAHSRAVVVGTWNYDFLPDLPAAGNSLRRMKRLLTGPLCGWPRDRISTFGNRRIPGNLPDQLITLFENARDVALFYYVGHGQIDADEQLCLGLGGSRTEPHRRSVTSLPFQAVRRALLESPATTKIIILDCCFSGLANSRTNTMAAVPDSVMDKTGGTGAYTMAASSAYATAWYQNDPGLTAPQTYFTKYLADLIEIGIPGLPAGLRLHQVFTKLRDNLGRDQRPIPDQRSIDAAREFIFAYNAAPQDTQGDTQTELRKLTLRLAEMEAEVQRLRARQQGLGPAGDDEQRQRINLAVREAEREIGETTAGLAAIRAEQDPPPIAPAPPGNRPPEDRLPSPGKSRQIPRLRAHRARQPAVPKTGLRVTPRDDQPAAPTDRQSAPAKGRSPASAGEHQPASPGNQPPVPASDDQPPAPEDRPPAPAESGPSAVPKDHLSALAVDLERLVTKDGRPGRPMSRQPAPSEGRPAAPANDRQRDSATDRPPALTEDRPPAASAGRPLATALYREVAEADDRPPAATKGGPQTPGADPLLAQVEDSPSAPPEDRQLAPPEDGPLAPAKNRPSAGGRQAASTENRQPASPKRGQPAVPRNRKVATAEGGRLAATAGRPSAPAKGRQAAAGGDQAPSGKGRQRTVEKGPRPVAAAGRPPGAPPASLARPVQIPEQAGPPAEEAVGPLAPDAARAAAGEAASSPGRVSAAPPAGGGAAAPAGGTARLAAGGAAAAGEAAALVAGGIAGRTATGTALPAAEASSGPPAAAAVSPAAEADVFPAADVAGLAPGEAAVLDPDGRPAAVDAAGAAPTAGMAAGMTSPAPASDAPGDGARDVRPDGPPAGAEAMPHRPSASPCGGSPADGPAGAEARRSPVDLGRLAAGERDGAAAPRSLVGPGGSDSGLREAGQRTSGLGLTRRRALISLGAAAAVAGMSAVGWELSLAR